LRLGACRRNIRRMNTPLDALQAIAERHSTRVFSNKPIERDILETIVDAARRAPTANNVQPWEFVVVTNAATRKQMAELTDWGKFIADSPACVAVFCKDTKYYLEDGSAATQTLLLAAAALGVQSCWVAGDKKAYAARMAELLGVPKDHKLVSLIPLGYASGRDNRTEKRELESVLHWEKY
jgi:nitroreductase